MKEKKFVQILAIALVIALMGPMAAWGAKPGIEFGEAMVVTGKVVAIDRQDRDVAVMGPEGNVVDMQVGKAAKNFDQIKVGDKVKLEYYEAMAVYLGPEGQPPQGTDATITATAPKGMKPAGEEIKVVDVSATIQQIDKAKRTVTLKGPEGNVIPVRVDKSVKAFDQLKVGDSVHVRFTEAVAIAVSKP